MMVMQPVDTDLSISIFIGYGIVVLLYFFVLNLLLTAIRRMGERHVNNRSVIDRDIHKTMTDRIDTSMHSFDSYNLAIIVLKALLITLSMAVIIVIIYLRLGPLLAALMILGVVAILWAMNYLIKHNTRSKSIQTAIKQYSDRTGNAGAIAILSVCLVFLLFIMLLFK
jgi:hypothetical protein